MNRKRIDLILLCIFAKIFLVKKFPVSLLFLIVWLNHVYASELPFIKGGCVVSIFHPESHKDSSLLKTISIFNEQIKVDVFEGYAVVNANYWFNNSSQHKNGLTVVIP